ncbi:MAG: hypothetical protein D6807_05475 [Alphaproteobacteria bacterium]|nr:MAG: hypothetical protein D6807_05475 [Alphaproteobacteria bacterium]
MSIAQGETMIRMVRRGFAHILVVFLIGLAGFAAVRPAAAADDILIIHRPAKHKMKPFFKSGDMIPIDGPVIQVFSKTGKQYDAIANDHENLKYSTEVGAACGSGKKMGLASIEIAGVSKSVYEGRKRSIDNRTVLLEFPFTLPDIPRTPVAACNHELDRRVAMTGKSRDYWLAHGFVVTYENAYTSRFTVSCSRPLLAGHLEVSELPSKVWIACLPVGLSPKPAPKGGKKGEAPGKPDTPPPPKPRKPLFKVRAEIAAHPQVLYTRQCPAKIRFSGTIKAVGRGKVVYRFEGSDWHSPNYSMNISSSGSRKTVTWTQQFDSPPASARLALPGGRKTPDHQGWAAIRILAPADQAGLSKKITYKVFCNSAPPARMPATRKPPRRGG